MYIPTASKELKLLLHNWKLCLWFDYLVWMISYGCNVGMQMANLVVPRSCLRGFHKV